MAAISVRDLDEDVAARLKVRVARHGRSMEAEVRTILTDTPATDEDDRPNLTQAIRERFADIGGVEPELPPRRDRPVRPICRSSRDRHRHHHRLGDDA